MTALDRLAELEAHLSEDPSATETPDEGDPSPREWRLWIVERLMGEDVELHLLVFHLLGIVAEPKSQAVAEWLADLAAVVAPRRSDEESAGELRRLLLGVARVMRQPVEMRTAAADMLMALTLDREDREVLAGGENDGAPRGWGEALTEEDRRLLEVVNELPQGVRTQVYLGVRGLRVGDLTQASTAFSGAYQDVQRERLERGERLRPASAGWTEGAE